MFFFFFQAEDGIRDHCVTGVQTCALPISSRRRHTRSLCDWSSDVCSSDRSEEHTSELQSHSDLVCRLLLRSEEHTYELQSHSDFVYRLLLDQQAFQRAPVFVIPAPPAQAEKLCEKNALPSALDTHQRRKSC